MELNTRPSVHGKRVAVLMTDGVEQIEYTSPRSFLEERGVQVTLVSPKDKGAHVQGVHHDQKGDQFEVELNVREADPHDFDALLLPGGETNPNLLRQSPESIAFIREFAREEKPIAAICHGPLALIDAGLAESTHLTSWPECEHDLRAAGAEWTDDPVVIDGRLVTSRRPDDLPQFNEALLRELEIDPAAADRGPSS